MNQIKKPFRILIKVCCIWIGIYLIARINQWVEGPGHNAFRGTYEALMVIAALIGATIIAEEYTRWRGSRKYLPFNTLINVDHEVIWTDPVNRIEVGPVFEDDRGIRHPLGKNSQEKISYWSIYGRRGDGTFVCMADCKDERAARELAKVFLAMIQTTPPPYKHLVGRKRRFFPE